MKTTIRFQAMREGAWPGKLRTRGERVHARFKTKFGEMFDLLKVELGRIHASDVVVSGFWRIQDITRSGEPYSDARPRDPGVLVQYVVGGQRYQLAADRFFTWQDNLYAIALSLEALRSMDRYGVLRGQQYEGLRALPASTGMSLEEAQEIIATLAEVPVDMVAMGGKPLEMALRAARAVAHPDKNGGDDAKWKQLEDAEGVLAARAPG